MGRGAKRENGWINFAGYSVDNDYNRMKLMQIIRHGPWRTRFWLGGLGLLLLVGTLFVSNFFISADKAVGGKMLGHDFLAFYTAGRFVIEHRPDQLYDLDAVHQYQNQIKRRYGLEVISERDFGPFWNPPFVAALFAPLALLSYPAALNLWMALNALALVGAWALLCRLAKARGWDAALLGLLLLVSLPTLQALNHGQNSALSLLLLSAAACCAFGGKPILAGVAGGLLCYKPQLAAVLAGLILLTSGRQALAAWIVTVGCMVLAATATIPHAWGDYLHRLPDNLRQFQEGQVYLWERHVTFKAFWRLLLQGRGLGPSTWAVQALTLLSQLVLGGALLGLALKRRWRLGASYWAAALTCAPLLMPFYFDYDLLMLAVGAALLAGSAMQEIAGDKPTHWLLAAWSVLFVALYFNPAISGRLHFNVVVLLLSIVGILMLRRAAQVHAHGLCRIPQPASGRRAAA